MDTIFDEVILSYNNYLSNIPTGLKNLIEYFRNEQIEQALEQISFFSEGVSWLLEVKDKLEKQNIFVDLEINKIIEFFDEINDGLKNKDYLLVADLFEYEILPFFKECKNIDV